MQTRLAVTVVTVHSGPAEPIEIHAFFSLTYDIYFLIDIIRLNVIHRRASYMTYENITLKKELDINNIDFLHHLELANGFSFPEEPHDCWEFLYVSKGTVKATSGPVTHTLYKDDILFHPPGETHRMQSNGMPVPSLVIIGFQCSSPAMDYFRGKKLTVVPTERALIGHLVEEAHILPLPSPDHPGYQKTASAFHTAIPFGAEQMIFLYLQQLLLQLIRRSSADSTFLSTPSSGRRHEEEELFYQIIAYMEDRLCEHLSIPQICRDNLISRSLLQQLFHDYTGSGAIDCFSLMKINAAKQLILHGQLNLTQIADYLGYSSIHYFSRQFKKLTGMSPSKYAASAAQHESP